MQESQLNTYSLLLGEYALISNMLMSNYNASVNAIEIPDYYNKPYSIVACDVYGSFEQFEMHVDVYDTDGTHAMAGDGGIVNFTTNWKSYGASLRDLSTLEFNRHGLDAKVDVAGTELFDYIITNRRLAKFPYEICVFTPRDGRMSLESVARVGADYYVHGVRQGSIYMRITDVIVAEAFVRVVLDNQLPGIARTYNSVRAITYNEGDFVTLQGKDEIGVVCSATPLAPLTYSDKVNVFFPSSRTVLTFYGFELEPVQR